MQDRTNEEVLEEIGLRLRRERMNQNLTQSQLADKAGLRQATVSRVESGQDFTVATLIGLLRALNRLDNVDAFLPLSPLSPIELANQSGRERKRVRRRAKTTEPAWQWSDQQDSTP